MACGLSHLSVIVASLFSRGRIRHPYAVRAVERLNPPKGSQDILPTGMSACLAANAIISTAKPRNRPQRLRDARIVYCRCGK